MERTAALWSRLRSSFWLLPAAFAVLSAAAGVVLVEYGVWDRGALAEWSPRLFGAGPAGSRAMLSSIASAMITVAGVVFSITVLTLSQTATQYSPSVLRNFTRDRATQASLGVFLGVFVYCIVVLRTVRGTDEQTYVPSVAVLFAIVYAMAGIGTLIFFIHHVAQSIQVHSILSRIAQDTAAAIDRGASPAADLPPPPLGSLPSHWRPVRSRRSGYVIGIDMGALRAVARESGRVLRLDFTMGAFVPTDATLVSLGQAEDVPPVFEKRICRALILDGQRSTDHDPGFGLQQLVDIALRALSPGVNDPTTAIMCIDQLGSLLGLLSRKGEPQAHVVEAGRLLLIVPVPGTARALEFVFHPLVRDGASQRPVAQALVGSMLHVASGPLTAEAQVALARVAMELRSSLTASAWATPALLASADELLALLPLEAGG